MRRRKISGLTDGFQAANNTGGLRCPDLDAGVLLKTEDVTAQLKTAGQSPAQRNAAIARMEKTCAAGTHNDCSAVRLFAGARYGLYQYRQYKDVRLVFAPEYVLAVFVKDRDNITCLRDGLIIAFLRVLEDGKPDRTADCLKWSHEGAGAGDLVFTSGNPRPTSRSATAAQLTFCRDTSLPLETARLFARIQ